MLILGACATGTEVPIGGQNTDVLLGSWKGTMQSRGDDGVVYFQTDAALVHGHDELRFRLRLGVELRTAREVYVPAVRVE